MLIKIEFKIIPRNEIKSGMSGPMIIWKVQQLLMLMKIILLIQMD